MEKNTNLFVVNQDKCLKCGACVRDCAFKALRFGQNPSLPVMDHPERCMRCQHCFAICPAGAITFDGNNPQNAITTSASELPSAKAVENWMKMRRSTRQFKKDDVDPQLLDKILKTLANTPTGCNARSLTFTCISNRAAMDAFRKEFISVIEQHREGSKLLPRWLAVPAIKLRNGGQDMFFRNAPSMLIVSSDEKAPGVTTPLEDVAIACSNFELIAQANGLATCWCGFLKIVQNEVPELLEKITGIRRTTPFYAILFGHSAVRYMRGVEREAYANIRIISE